jgi:hypothetical protein
MAYDNAPPFDTCQCALPRRDWRQKPEMEVVAIIVDTMRDGWIDTISCLAGLSLYPAFPDRL